MPTSISRRPRLKVNINGVPIAAAYEAEVKNASHFSADTFRIVLAISALPAAMGLSWWDNVAFVTAEVFIGSDDPSLPWLSLIYGQVDDINIELEHGRILLTGRDLSAQFIDTKTTDKFQNLTSSQIATQLAARHGLAANIAPTSTLAGSYYEIDHARLTQEQTEWDLLTYLAEHEGYDVWVSGKTLNFQPAPAPSSIPYVLTWIPSLGASPASNFIRINLRRALTLARDIIVVVKSWHQGQEKSCKVTYKLIQASKGQRAGGNAQTYSYTVPNLTRDQALQYAKNKAEQISRHERVITAELPGDNVLNTRTMVKLIGTGTKWDQLYYPDTIKRRISFDEGYRMELRAKNHSPQSTVIV